MDQSHCVYSSTLPASVMLSPLAKDQNWNRINFLKEFQYLLSVADEEDCLLWETRGMNGQSGSEFEADMPLNRCSTTGVCGGEDSVLLEDKEGLGTWKSSGKLDIVRRFWCCALNFFNEMPLYCRSSRARANSISKCYNMQSCKYVKSPEKSTT